MAKEDDTRGTPFGHYGGAPMKVAMLTGDLIVFDVLPRHSANLDSVLKYGRQVAVRRSGVWLCPVLHGRCNEAQLEEIAGLVLSFTGTV